MNISFLHTPSPSEQRPGAMEEDEEEKEVEAATIVCHKARLTSKGSQDPESSLVGDFQLIDDVRVRCHRNITMGNSPILPLCMVSSHTRPCYRPFLGPTHVEIQSLEKYGSCTETLTAELVLKMNRSSVFMHLPG